MQTIEELVIKESIENTPDEVIDFLHSKAFAILLNGIQKVLNLTDVQKYIIELNCYDILINHEKEIVVFENLVRSGMDEQTALKCLYLIETEIVERAAMLAEDYETEEEVPIDKAITVNSAPSPSDVLASLGERLSKATIVTPTSRTYTSTRTDQKTIDPYRETPEL